MSILHPQKPWMEGMKSLMTGTNGGVENMNCVLHLVSQRSEEMALRLLRLAQRDEELQQRRYVGRGDLEFVSGGHISLAVESPMKNSSTLW